MRVVVAVALDDEWAPWRRRHRFTWITDAIAETTVGTTVVRVCAVGVGAVQLAGLSDLLTERDVVLACGLSGSLRSDCARGTIVVSRQVRSPGIPSAIASDPRLVAAALDCGARAVDTLLSVPGIIRTAADKRARAADADVVDMESFAVLRDATERGLRVVAIRAIGDAVDDDVPIDFSRALRRNGSIDYLALAGHVATRPVAWPAILRFTRRQRSAIRSLTTFLDRFVATLDESF